MSNLTVQDTGPRLTTLKKFSQSQKQRKRVSIVIRWLVALLLMVFAVFPVIWIISASFNPADTLATQTLIPRNSGLDTYRELLNTPARRRQTAGMSAPPTRPHSPDGHPRRARKPRARS